MTLPATTPAPQLEDALPEPPFPVALVEEFMRCLARAVKTHQLYLPNNPIYQRAIEQFQHSFVPIWAHTSELVLTIGESEFTWMGRVVLHEPSRTESLAWVFFKDGLRELTVQAGFEADESTALLDILQRVRKAAPDEDDLLTLLWEQEFSFLRYRYVDVGVDGVVPIQADEAAAQTRQLPLVDIRAETEEVARQSGIVRMEDLDSALYFLDESEIEYLHTAIQRDQHENPRPNVLAIVLDIFETQSDLHVRQEVCEIFESFLPILLSAGDYGSVAYLLREAEALPTRRADLQPEVVDRLGRLPEAISAAGVLPQLLQSLDDATVLPAHEDLDALFAQLLPSTLGLVLGWLKMVRRRELREVLESAATRLAASHTGELLKLMLSSDAAVAIEAMRRAAELKTPAAVGQLGKVMASGTLEARQAAAAALAGIGSPGAMRILENALDDEDRDIRVTAVRAVGQAGHRSALPRIESVVRGTTARAADLTEKMARFEAYALLAGEAGVEPLDALLNARGSLLRRKVEPDIRACAAMALGRIGSDSAFEALRRAAGDKDPRVRSAINRALREGDA